MGTPMVVDVSNFYNRDDISGIPTSIASSFNRWLAPELLAEKRPTFTCDIYSFSVVLCEATSGMNFLLSLSLKRGRQLF